MNFFVGPGWWDSQIGPKTPNILTSLSKAHFALAVTANSADSYKYRKIRCMYYNLGYVNQVLLTEKLT